MDPSATVHGPLRLPAGAGASPAARGDEGLPVPVPDREIPAGGPCTGRYAAPRIRTITTLRENPLFARLAGARSVLIALPTVAEHCLYLDRVAATETFREVQAAVEAHLFALDGHRPSRPLPH